MLTPSSILHKILVCGAVVPLFVILLFSRTAKAHDLNGRWKCNDGAVYEIHQSGDRVSWDGLGPGFHNRFQGVIMNSLDGPIILGIWRDVEGSTVMNHGILSLQIVNGNTLSRHFQEGNFGGSAWQRVVAANKPAPAHKLGNLQNDNVGKAGER
jgi:hypothetical protein